MAIILNGTDGVTYPDGVLQSSGVPAPSTSGNVLTSDGTNWTSAALPANPPAFTAGTRLGFQQTSAPTGWTKDTTAAINDSILRLVTGSVTSGGSTAFSTFNGQTTVGATTLSTTQIPAHSHSGVVASGSTLTIGSNFNSWGSGSTNNTGGGGSHNHSITTSIKYYDFIIGTKD